MKKIAIAALLSSMAFGAIAADANHGKIVYTPKCMGCHGAQGKGLVGPDLTNLTAAEAEAKLISYRNKEEIGPRSGMMWGVSRTLGDGDIADLAAYIETL